MRLFQGTEWDIPPKCDRCGKLEEECGCEPIPEVVERIPPEKQTARLQIEKRKKGKVVTVVHGLSEGGNDLPDLLKRLKAACGCGGTVKDETIEIQGKHLDRVRETLSKIGYKVKG